MIKNIFQSAFLKNVLALVSATALAQVINFLFNIVLTRLYTPEQFGSLSVFIAIVSFLMAFASAKFDVAIVATQDEQDAKKLFALSFWFTFIVSGLVLLWLILTSLFHLPQNEVMEKWKFFIVPSVIFLTGFQICWMWNVRIKNFKRISVIRVTETLVNGGMSVLLAGITLSGLLFATLSGQFVSFVLLLLIVFVKTPMKEFVFSFSELKHTFKKYSMYPKINVPQGFLEIFQVSAFALFLEAFFDTAVTGFFSLGMRVLQVPVRLLVLPVSHVFFAEASDLYRNGKSIYPIVKKAIIRMFFIALPIPIILVFAGPYLFSLVFGQEWEMSGKYAQILALWTFFDLIKAPVVQVASIVNQQKKILYVSLLASSLFVMAFLIGGWYYHQIELTLWLITIAQSLVSIFTIWLVLKISK